MSQKTHMSPLAGPSTVEHGPMSSIVCFPCPKGPPCCRGQMGIPSMMAGPGWGIRTLTSRLHPGFVLNSTCSLWPIQRMVRRRGSPPVNPGSVLWSLGPLLPSFCTICPLGWKLHHALLFVSLDGCGLSCYLYPAVHL